MNSASHSRPTGRSHRARKNPGIQVSRSSADAPLATFSRRARSLGVCLSLTVYATH